MSDKSGLKFELVLPCYNEGNSLEAILKKTIEAAKTHSLSPKDFQLILVENGSRDESLKIMLTLKQNPNYGSWFSIVEVKVNEGYGHGVWQGLQATTAPTVSWSHSDQQCDPMDAFKALSILRAGTQDLAISKTLIKGKRHGRSLPERFVSRTFEFLAGLILSKPFHEINAQPKVFSRSLLSEIKNPPKDFSFDLYVLYVAMKNAWKIQTIDVQFPPRVHGISNWAFSLKSRRKTIWNMILYMFKLRKDSVGGLRAPQAL